jgi:hypothetical protein
MATRLERRVVAKTADYTIRPPFDSPGTLFTNAEASGAVVFTLPTPNKAVLGHWYEFMGLVDQLITVAAPTADTLIGFNDLDLDSIATGGSGQRIGAIIRVYCIFTAAGVYRWIAEGATPGVTFVLAD